MLRSRQLPGLLVAIAAAGFVFWQLRPDLVFSSTTPTGGDLGAHVWAPWFMREELLPSGRIAGWANDWWGGFAAYRFYFPLPALLIVLLDLVLPYGIAMKLVVILGPVSLPLSAYAFGRLSRLRAPGPAFLAAGSLLFLFDTSFTIWGGNVASTMAGEFSFALALSIALLFLGVVARGLDTGRHRVAATLLLLATGMSHILVTLFAVVAALVLLALRVDRQRLWWLASVGIGAALLIAFWALPLVARLPYANDLGWTKITTYVEVLFPTHMRWVFVPAGLGILAAIALRVRSALSLLAIGTVAAIGVVLVPEWRVWNARLLPFYYLAVYLLAAVGTAEFGRALARAFTPEDREPETWKLAVSPVLGLGLVVALLGGRLDIFPQYLPGAAEDDGRFLTDWIEWDLEGYEAKETWPEYSALMETMAGLPCGTALWENHREVTIDYGTPMALMLLPFWTDGCINSMEGLYFESSRTVPYHFLTQLELSPTPSAPQQGLPYSQFDVPGGVDHLQMLGVRYYLAGSDQASEAADAEPDLTLLTTSGPWRIYEVASVEHVAGLPFQPTVLDHVGPGEEWLEVTAEWFMDPDAWDRPLAADGPTSWRRASPEELPLAPSDAADRLPRVAVSNFTTTDGHISFDVDRPGIPVVVRESYFPNWRAQGADGPYRLSPNMMVVVPTDTHIELAYARTGIDLVGFLLTLGGLALLILVLRRTVILRNPSAGLDSSSVVDSEPEGHPD